MNRITHAAKRSVASECLRNEVKQV